LPKRAVVVPRSVAERVVSWVRRWAEGRAVERPANADAVCLSIRRFFNGTASAVAM